MGVAGGDGKGVIIRGGEIIKTCREDEIEDELMREVESIIAERELLD